MSFSFCLCHVAVGETTVKLNIYFPTVHSECECSKSPPLGCMILAIAHPPGGAKRGPGGGGVGGGGGGGRAQLELPDTLLL